MDPSPGGDEVEFVSSGGRPRRAVRCRCSVPDTVGPRGHHSVRRPETAWGRIVTDISVFECRLKQTVKSETCLGLGRPAGETPQNMVRLYDL